MKDKLLQQDAPSFFPEILKQVIDSQRIAIIGNQEAGKTHVAKIEVLAEKQNQIVLKS